MWVAAVALLFAIAPCAAYVSIINDITDRSDDMKAGKLNRLAGKPPWLLVLLVVAPISAGLVAAFLWRDAPALVGAYLCAWMAFSLYSLPPFRLKARDVLGVLADASGAHLFPALVGTLVAFRALGKDIDPTWIATVGAWALGYGLRGILWHQL